jgi:6-pyruvoyltetrahydropterin/6-carboxytetrahydropterin synthase
MYVSKKRYGHEEGLSCAFRQHRATHSHCRFLHGYALAITLTFECDTLDARNWCMDFGGLKDIKAWLKDRFDHTTAIAADDPELLCFRRMAEYGLLQLRVFEGVGCEKFSEQIYHYVSDWLAMTQPALDGVRYRVRLRSVEVAEHGANSAVYEPATKTG